MSIGPEPGRTRSGQHHFSMKALGDSVVVALNGARDWLLGQQWFTSTLLPALPRPVRWGLRRLYFLPSDVIDRFSGRRAEMIPPKSKIFTGSVDDFQSSGTELLMRLVRVAALTPDAVVLDIGSGMGRLAVPLTSYLDRAGRYEGLDVVPSGVRWCTANIASKHPNFHFTLADVFNKEYHPGGRLKAADYDFTYADATFDIAVLSSVFTHMLPADMEHYIEEISRVLKPGGRCYATYQLVNEESLRLMREGRSDTRFKHHIAPYWTVDEKVPELSIGYDEQYVRSLFERLGVSARIEVYYGTWSGRPEAYGPGWESQDLVVAVK